MQRRAPKLDVRRIKGASSDASRLAVRMFQPVDRQWDAATAPRKHPEKLDVAMHQTQCLC